MPSWSGLPMPLRPGSGAVRIDAACERVSKLRRPVWLVVLCLLLSVDVAATISCRQPEREPTAEEREQLFAHENQLRASQAALSAALRADPLLGPELRRFARVGMTLFDPLAEDADPPIEEALKLAQEDELLALVLLWDRHDLDAGQRAKLIERWRAQGLPWTVLAAWPVDLEDATDRRRFAAELRESLTLPINNPLAVRARTLGIRYFELADQHPKPQLSEALLAVQPSCDRQSFVVGVIAALSLEVTIVAVQFGLLQDDCMDPPIELDEICTLWSKRLQRETLFGWIKSIDPEGERAERLSERIEACGPLTMLHAFQDHYGDWDAVEARLRDCVPVAAEAADRAPD